MRGINNILFDMGGVLVDISRQSCVDAYLKLGFRDVNSYLGDYGQKGPFLKIENGELTEQQFYDAIHAIIPNASNKEIADAFNQFITGLPVYRLELLSLLKAKGYRLMLLSNTNPIVFEKAKELFTQLGLTINNYFDDIFCSYQIKAIKPDPQAFQSVIEISGIVPEETLFIDDSQNNLNAAMAFGFETLLATDGMDLREKLLP
ncbi:MAG: HAD family phosphatase [Bacteroidales bacterium]|nr:HAD family phosphatase [Bacteroidales bacterium]